MPKENGELKQSEIREELRKELRTNIVFGTMVVQQHRPWTHVTFKTWYRGSRAETIEVDLWGVSKVCWTDRWSERGGASMAINRALGWAVTDIIPPIEDPGLEQNNDV